MPRCGAACLPATAVAGRGAEGEDEKDEGKDEQSRHLTVFSLSMAATCVQRRE